MRFLIRLLAQWIAARLQQGDPRAAFLGAVIGSAGGAVAAYALSRADALETFRYAAFVILPIAGALVGGLAGSALPDRRGFRADRPVRINNLNRGLVPLFAFCVFTAAAVLVHRVPSKEGPSFRRNVSAGAGLFALVAIAFALRVVLLVDVGDDGVVVRRLLGRRLYALDRVKRWGFEVSRGKLVQSPPSFVVPLLITFDDGFTFEAPGIHPSAAAALAARLPTTPTV